MSNNPSLEPIVLLGGGGHCQACLDVIGAMGVFAVKGIVDLPGSLGREIQGYRVEYTDVDLQSLIPRYRNVLVCLGQIKTPEPRRLMFRKAGELGAAFPSPVSPLAYVSPSAKVDGGSIIMHHALVNAGAEIGFGCIVNSKALLEHGARIAEFCHVATGAIINGDAAVGEGCFVGSGAVVAQGVEIGAGCVIGASAVVLANVPPGQTVIGTWK